MPFSEIVENQVFQEEQNSALVPTEHYASLLKLGAFLGIPLAVADGWGTIETAVAVAADWGHLDSEAPAAVDDVLRVSVRVLGAL